jgi:hypothetical protein
MGEMLRQVSGSLWCNGDLTEHLKNQLLTIESLMTKSIIGILGRVLSEEGEEVEQDNSTSIFGGGLTIRHLLMPSFLKRV